LFTCDTAAKTADSRRHGSILAAVLFALMIVDHFDRRIVVSLLPQSKGACAVQIPNCGLVSFVSIAVAPGAVPLSILADRCGHLKRSRCYHVLRCGLGISSAKVRRHRSTRGNVLAVDSGYTGRRHCQLFERKYMRKRSVVVLIAAALSAGVAIAQTAPAPPPARTVKAIQPGLLEVVGPDVNDIYGAGIQKITATPGKGARSIRVHSPFGDSYFGWPNDVKPVAFTIETAKNGGVTISAPGYTEANKADYKAAINAVVPLAIDKGKAQRKLRR
jgi:hypothetical protein